MPDSKTERIATGFLPTDWLADVAYVRSFDLEVPFPIVAKARARVFQRESGGFGACQPAHYRKCVDNISLLLRSFRPKGWDTARTYAIMGIIRCQSVTDGDLDNLIGTVMDAGNGVVWIDDRQVTMAPVVKLIATPKAQKSLLTIYELFEGWLDPSEAMMKRRAKAQPRAKKLASVS